ncbi:2'-5' RNA ligase [Heyndrickxia sporothermodurans]|uniref:RNA 2',3'-cyclic phosphodiesterase n=1 Tax=Heyndrickxia sporothermodurans TaxID=46224 RepID=A0AB37H6Z4_9BACI|nr:RNA 2',3'-cyclic phosphodiesterase [Heyndrickxia sporothermodurans]MBL5768256.1 RNA 2',3'-cyclic phosphodiesterase [Heyndrickxia sporothermodurans]MBL5771880.1 RNA 2',3'-cyclic phosphodiesterase [Heyndrickxia sporothermodurans]MBL5775486.1 RNA 2',3'-cyclic phosphodiesterase [Heyndrickxia sporothermodurans]MBL5778941.1 RNA 2',3'-cyclic phosphodiesterase [Heyndrickxia sporothermodurans]MBL5782591.1 RNA 2',3'-cyclic phosphodiesterase [Heyndrickxia sporothermodurans]
MKLSNKHYFFAVPLPPDIKESLFQLCENIKIDHPFKRWVHKEDYHITLAFLGDADHTQLMEAIHVIKESLASSSSFNIKINHLGIFGREKAPRIFWAGLLESPELNMLRGKVYESCLKAGFQLDKKPFNPHITLARKWDETKQNFTLEKLKEINLNALSFPVNQVVLYETNIEATPKYQKKAVMHLGDD